MNRETIYAALFAKLQTAAGFTTISRRLEHIADTSPAELPALYQIQKNEIPQQLRGLPTKWRLAVDLYIYVQTTDHTISGSSALNPLIDAVENALAFDPVTGTQNLSGTVSHCWISGNVQIFEGVQDVYTVAIIPIEILTDS